MDHPTSQPQATDQQKGTNRALILWGALGLVLVLGIAGASLFMVNQARQETAAALDALEAEREEAAAAEAAREAEAEAQAEAEAEAAAEAEAEAEAQAAEDEAERRSRERAVGGIEDAVSEMAEEHADDGIIDGPVLSVTCSPVAGGSLDDLTETTTVFECFAATEDLGDGRFRGTTYNATMNWDTGRYTYGLGAP